MLELKYAPIPHTKQPATIYLTMTPNGALLSLLVAACAPAVSSFSPAAIQGKRMPGATAALRAMERLHDPSTNAYSVEHVYSLRDIDVVTRKIADDEWTALGSIVAEALYEMILDVGDDALKQRGWVDRMSLTNKISEEVSGAVEVSRAYLVRSMSFFVHPFSTNLAMTRDRHRFAKSARGRAAPSRWARIPSRRSS